jgi:thiamine biosynthesis lipoprotein
LIAGTLTIKRALKIVWAALAAAVLLCLTCCKAGVVTDEPYIHDFFAADTFISLKVYGGADPASLCEKVEAKTAELEQVLSCHLQSSELSKINSSPSGEYELSDELAEVISTSLDMADLTRGAYDPTVAPLSELWNIGGGNEKVPPQSEIDEARSKTDYKNFELRGNILVKHADYAEFDLGGSGKGYMLGKAVEILSRGGGYGVASFGGNIGVFGKKPSGEPWKIGIKNPRDEAGAVGYVEIEFGFVAVSGDYERYFISDGSRYCHIIDPATGRPPQNGVMSVAVWTENAIKGDILSTALFVMGEQEGLRFCEENEIAALFVTERGISCSPAMERIFKKTG